MADQDQVAIVGIGQNDYSRKSGRSELMLALQAIHVGEVGPIHEGVACVFR